MRDISQKASYYSLLTKVFPQIAQEKISELDNKVVVVSGMLGALTTAGPVVGAAAICVL